MKNIKEFLIKESDSKIEQTFIDCLALGLRYAGGETIMGGERNPDHLKVSIQLGSYKPSEKINNKLIARCAGQIIEQWVIDNIPSALEDSEGNLWLKTLPDYTTHYDMMFYKESDNTQIKIEVKSYKDGQIKNVKYSSNNQKDDVDLYIFVDYSLEDSTIVFNSIKLSWKGDTLSQINTKKNIPAKIIKNAKDVKSNDTGNAIMLSTAGDKHLG